MDSRQDKPVPLTAAEYEDYVEAVIREISFWDEAKVHRNRRYPGVRQRGEYEIDIAFEVTLGKIVDFLLIVECKNYTRPVSRPVVQQLAQTRDAINAQKAAIASPVGFTRGAIALAKDLGIALWVIAVDGWGMSAMANDGLFVMLASDTFFELRSAFLGFLGVMIPERDRAADSTLVDASEAYPREPPTTVHADDGTALFSLGPTGPRYSRFCRHTVSGSAHFSHANHPLFGQTCAQREILDAVVDAVGYQHLIRPDERDAFAAWEQDVGRRVRAPAKPDDVLASIVAGDFDAFYGATRRW